MRPSELPRVRGRLAAWLTDPPDHVHGDWIPAAAQDVRLAALYWTTAPMAALAVHAGATLENWPDTEPPSSHGLMVYDGGIGAIPTSGYDLPVSAVTWGPEGTGWRLGLWVDREWSLDHLAKTQEVVRPHIIPPLVATGTYSLPPTGKAPETILRTVAASWLLMQQETIADRTVQEPIRALRRQAARAGLGDPTVTIVDLRRQYWPDGREETGEEDGRRYRHRWVVSGHWRDQPWGPDRSLRRRTWIAAYVKGPEGAPLLATERVNVWRR